MDSNHLLVIVSIVAALSAATMATPVMAQNMTGGNMTDGNMTGKVSSVEGCPVSAEGTYAEFCAPDEGQNKGQNKGQDESCPVSAEGIAFCPEGER